MYHKLNSYQLTGYKNTYTVLSIQIGYYNIISCYNNLHTYHVYRNYNLPSIAKKLSRVLP